MALAALSFRLGRFRRSWLPQARLCSSACDVGAAVVRQSRPGRPWAVILLALAAAPRRCRTLLVDLPPSPAGIAAGTCTSCSSSRSLRATM